MKRIYAFLLCISLMLCTGCGDSDMKDKSFIWESIVANSPSNLFLSTLERDENGQFIYPDSFGGMCLEDGNTVF